MLGKKICICVLWTYRKYYQSTRKVLEWAMRKKGIPEILFKSVMSQNEGAKTSVEVNSELLLEFETNV